MTDSTDIAYLPATEALRRFRDRSLSPVELMTAVIARAEAVEPKVNALAERTFEGALAAAREAEARYGGKGEAPRALEGLAVATKEEQPIAGRRITDGSLAFVDEVAKETHPVIERVQGAGGIVHARTTTPEFSCAGYTQSRLWGVTRNPWNVEFTPGGSSGGAGAALAAGETTLATGSDIGGSIRIPASYTGTVGYKPPYGRVPAMAPFNLDTYCHDGPMARTVGDCALLENVGGCALVEADAEFEAGALEPPGEPGRVDHGHVVLVPHAAEERRGVDLGADRLGVEQHRVAAEPGEGLGLLLQSLDLVRLGGHHEGAGALPGAVDAVSFDRVLDGLEVLAAEAFQEADLLGPALDSVGQAVGEAGLAESAVAAGGGAAGLVRLDEHHVQGRIALLRDEGGPQAGVSAADHEEVAGVSPTSAVVGCGRSGSSSQNGVGDASRSELRWFMGWGSFGSRRYGPPKCRHENAPEGKTSMGLT